MEKYKKSNHFTFGADIDYETNLVLFLQ